MCFDILGDELCLSLLYQKAEKYQREFGSQWPSDLSPENIRTVEKYRSVWNQIIVILQKFTVKMNGHWEYNRQQRFEQIGYRSQVVGYSTARWVTDTHQNLTISDLYYETEFRKKIYFLELQLEQTRNALIKAQTTTNAKTLAPKSFSWGWILLIFVCLLSCMHPVISIYTHLTPHTQ